MSTPQEQFLTELIMYAERDARLASSDANEVATALMLLAGYRVLLNDVTAALARGDEYTASRTHTTLFVQPALAELRARFPGRENELGEALKTPVMLAAEAAINQPESHMDLGRSPVTLMFYIVFA